MKILSNFYLVLLCFCLSNTQNASAQSSTSNKSKIDTIAICLLLIRIENHAKNQELKDSALYQALNKTILNEIHQVLADRYTLVQLPNIDAIDAFKQEMDSTTNKQLTDKKKRKQQYSYSYFHKLPVTSRYVFVVTVDGEYDSNIEFTAPLEQSLRASQLAGGSMFAIPLNSTNRTSLHLCVFLLDNVAQQVLYKNEYQSKSDPRNLELVKSKLYKLLKPVYYY